MTKGEETKEAILREAAQLFNRRGYSGSALSDVMKITGLEKGGIYNHFKSKDDLALQAFDYAVNLVRQELSQVMTSNRDNVERLYGMIRVFQREAGGYPLAGGCPVMNTAIEADDTHPALRERARAAMEEWHDLVRRVVRRGQDKGEIRATVDTEMFTVVFISVLEGAIMQSKLYGNTGPMDQAVQYLHGYIEHDIKAE